MRELRALDERLQACLAVAVFFRVLPLGVLFGHPRIHILLQLIERAVEFSPERARVELIPDGLVKSLADPVGLR